MRSLLALGARRVRHRPPRELAIAAAEVVLATVLSTACIASLQDTAPAQGLGVLYILAVLVVAIRRGELAALTTALLSMLTLNYLFIDPRHQLTIAHSQDVVELGVLLVVAVVVGRLAATGRERAAEAERRAVLGARQEREAVLLAQAASAILAGTSVAAALETLGDRVARAIGSSQARVALESVPAPQAQEIAMPLRARTRTAWLYVSRDTGWEADDLERIAEPLGRLIDVAVERERVAERAAETEAARRADTARTAILHAISHDLRTPLTAITTAGSGLRWSA